MWNVHKQAKDYNMNSSLMPSVKAFKMKNWKLGDLHNKYDSEKIASSWEIQNVFNIELNDQNLTGMLRKTMLLENILTTNAVSFLKCEHSSIQTEVFLNIFINDRIGEKIIKSGI